MDAEFELNRSLMNIVLVLIMGHFNSRHIKIWPLKSYSGDVCLVKFWFDGQSYQKTLEICVLGDREIDLEGSRSQNVSRENNHFSYFRISLTNSFSLGFQNTKSLIISIHLENNLSVG